jgi:hypothetical protein
MLLIAGGKQRAAQMLLLTLYTISVAKSSSLHPVLMVVVPAVPPPPCPVPSAAGLLQLTLTCLAAMALKSEAACCVTSTVPAGTCCTPRALGCSDPPGTRRHQQQQCTQ